MKASDSASAVADVHDGWAQVALATSSLGTALDSVVNTGTPGTKTFNFLVTGTSVPATTDNGTGTIYPGAQIPNDCSLAYVSSKSKSLTCTGRPSGQEWDFDLLCPDAPSFFRNAMGNEVTGDGTSTATCIDGTAYDTGDFET